MKNITLNTVIDILTCSVNEQQQQQDEILWAILVNNSNIHTEISQ
jgi:hypothetical protein